MLKFLGSAGVACAVGGGASVPAVAEGPHGGNEKRHGTGEDSFPPGAAVRGATIDSLRADGWDVVNVVEQGLDNSGETPVSEELNALLTDNTVLVFPEGEYLLDKSVNDGSVDNLALIGEPGTKPTLRVHESFYQGSEYPRRLLFAFGFGDGTDGLVIRNFEVNMEGAGVGAGGFSVITTGKGAYLKEIDFVGENDSPNGNVALAVTDPDATMSIHDVRMPDGASRVFDVPSLIDSSGIIATRATTGDVHLGNCVVGGFPNNGVYASKVGFDGNPGRVIVRGGEFYNSDRDQLRVGSQSEIHHAHCYSDTIKPGFNNLRGIWVRHADGVLIKNTTVEQLTSDSGAGIRISGTSGGMTIKNTRIQLDSPDFGVWVLEPQPPTGGGFARPPNSGTKIRCKNVSINGSAAGKEAVRIEGRDGSHFKNMCIELTGGDRDGMVFSDTDATVRNVRIDVTGEQIVANDSDVETRNVREAGHCPPPNDR